MFSALLYTAFFSLLFSYGESLRLVRGEPDVPAANSTLNLRMPGVVPKKDDDYICMPFRLNDLKLFITHFKANASAERAHHILLYGCTSPIKEDNAWDCGHHGICTGQQSILFAWAKNAPATELPPSVGFEIGQGTAIKYLVMQIHYAHPLAPGVTDSSGLDLTVTTEEQNYIAGIQLLLAQNVFIPPHVEKVHADINCRMKPPATMHLFAYRVHAHKLGRVVTGYRVSDGKMEEIARGNPQWPQAFYPMKEVYNIKQGDYLAARCTFNSSEKSTYTYIGSTAGDEMCNLYLMYYTDAKAGKSYGICVDQETTTITRALPADSDEPLPPNPLLEEHAIHGNAQMDHSHSHMDSQNKSAVNLEKINYETLFGKSDTVAVPEKKAHKKKPLNEVDSDVNSEVYSNDQYDENKIAEYENPVKTPETTAANQIELENDYQVDSNWPSRLQSQPSAVAVDSRGNVVIFHRANRVWDVNTFNSDNRLVNPQLGPIPDATLALLDSKSGKIINQAGMSMFYVPHGLTVDHEDNLWVTDVGAHQVFKLTPLNESVSSVQVLLELGKALQPGSDSKHFCKPTSVAVLPTGDFFVADGYCNSRIIKYDKKGNRLFEWGESPRKILGFGIGNIGVNTLDVPHSLALVTEKDLLCVADRENGRIVCYSVTDGSYRLLIKRQDFHTVYGLASLGTKLYVVNNPSGSSKAQGFILDLNSNGALTGVFATNGSLGQPHCLAVNRQASEIYVAEIQPYRIVKLITKSNGSAVALPVSSTTEKQVVASSNSSQGLVTDSSTFSSWTVLLSLIAVPVLCLVLVITLIRLRKRGFCNCCSGSRSKSGQKLDLGSLLGRNDPSRGGFEKLALDDSDIDIDIDTDSDNEVVEFSKSIKGRGLKA